MAGPPIPFTSKFSSLVGLIKQLTRVKPRESKITLGVDIGSTAVKVVALGPRRGMAGRPLLGQQVIAMEKEAEPDAADTVKRALSALPVSSRVVNLSVSGPWVIIRVVEMPVMSPAEVKQALPFEAQRFLPFNIQDVVLDGAVLGPLEANKQWVLIVACKKELLERRVDCALRAGCEVALIDVDALALVNAFLAGHRGRNGHTKCALINVGAQLTNLIVFQGDIPYLVRDIPWGGDKLIRSLADQQQTDVETAAQALRQERQSPEWLGAMKTACESLIQELQLSFDYFENRFGQPPEQIFVTGGVGQSAAVVEAVKSHLTQTVSRWTPVDGVLPQCAVAYGLALRSD